MEDFVFEPWKLDRENDEMVSVFRWGERKDEDYGEVQRIRVTLMLGKGDNPSMLAIKEEGTDVVLAMVCDDLPDLLNKMESYLADY